MRVTFFLLNKESSYFRGGLYRARRHHSLFSRIAEVLYCCPPNSKINSFEMHCPLPSDLEPLALENTSRGAFGSEENLRYIKKAPPPPLFVRSRKGVGIKDHAMAETPTVAVRPLLVHTNQDLSLLFVQSIQHYIILFIKRYLKDENNRKLGG